MKKLFTSITVLLLIVSFANYSNAQSVGIRLGGNVANLSTDLDGFDPSSRFNFTIGAFGIFDIGSGPLKLQPEINFEGKGAKTSDPNAPGLEFKQKLGYLTIPVFLDFYFAGDKLFLQAGPYFGFLLNADLNVSGSLGTLGGDNKDDFNSTDIGLGIGGGVDLGRVDFTLRYMLGLNNISAVDDVSTKTRTFNISVGFKILKQD